jgi:hypothetical protein
MTIMTSLVPKPLIISSERKAWNALERLLTDDREVESVQFEGWPTVELVLKGERYSSSMPSGLMRQVSGIQTLLNRLYGRLAYEGDGRRLKHAERAEIELVYKVREGSIDLKADATGLLNRLGDALTKRGTQKGAILTLITLALMIEGGQVILGISSNRRDVEIKHLELLQKALEKAPEIKDAPDEFLTVYKRIVAAASDADHISIGDASLNADEIVNLVGQQGQVGKRVELHGDYYVSSLRRHPKYLVIDIVLDEGEHLKARVLFDEFTSSEIEVLSASVVHNKPVLLRLSAVEYDDGFAYGRVRRIGH